MKLIDACADLFLGSTCPGCDRPSWGFCFFCLDSLDQRPELVVRKDLLVATANPYRPILNHAIPRYKENGALHLEQILAQRLACAIAKLHPPADAVVVPVPSLRAAVRRRGFDHAHRLAKRAAALSGLASSKAVRRMNIGYDQQGLTRAGRGRNIRNTMVARSTAGPAIIIDDIVTTGSSLAEARRALLHSETTVLGAAVIANADR